MINPQIEMPDSLNHWGPAIDPVHFDKPKFVGVGPAIGFAEEMLGDRKNIHIGLIPCAWDGSPLKACGSGAVYLKPAHSHDDAEISHYTIVAPLLKKPDFDATFTVCKMPWITPAIAPF